MKFKLKSKAEIDQLHAEIDQLHAENQLLNSVNQRFTYENKEIKSNLESLRSFVVSLKKPFWIDSDISYITPNYDDPVPPQAHYSRIAGLNQLSGSDGNNQFIESGFLDAKEIARIFEVYSGRKIDSNSQILDWGVGLSRILRHLKCTKAKLVGVDVDSKTIDFCKKNYAFADFFHIQTDEQNFLSNQSFDLVYGFSVMTHLSKVDQIFFLQKLQKVLKKNGLLFLTIHGPTSVLKTEWSEDQTLLKNYFSCGHVDGVENKDILGEVPTGYYRDVATTHKYIYEKWSEFFDVLDIVANGLGQEHGLSVQDLVIMKLKD
jgi:2-polyprenyl-3-methyl-5-hydroxy-6-metoxy-1,4-benzoquinol methylase